MIDSKKWALVVGLCVLGGLFGASIPQDGFRWYALAMLSAIAMEIAKLREKGK